MTTATVKTYQATAQDRERDWWVVDADGKTLGRLATQIAEVLRGKRKPTYTPHVDVGDFVIVVNAEKIAVTGKKLTDKRYYRHSGYPGGIRSRTLGEMLDRRPEEVIRKAVKGMLPRNRLARSQLTKLKVYAGPDHPHAAQKPKELEIRDLMTRERRRAAQRRPGTRGGIAPRGDPRGRGGPRRPRRRPRLRGPRRPRRHPRLRRPRRPRRPPAAEEAAPPQSRPEPAAAQQEGDKKEKKADVVPGAELDPIALEPERELSAEEKARAEAEAEERARREAELSAAPDDTPLTSEPTKLSGDARFLATGKRKSSVARVMLTPGDGKIEVNKRSLEEYFPRAYLQTVAKQALVQAGYEGNVDVRVRVHGGGISGQASAVRHGIARRSARSTPRCAPS